jgi:hypothetical protein
VYSFIPIPLSELFRQLTSELQGLGVYVKEKPFSLYCISYSNARPLLFEVNVYQDNLLEVRRHSGDHFSFGCLIKELQTRVSYLFSPFQPYEDAKEEKMQQWEDSARRAVINHQMNWGAPSVPSVPLVPSATSVPITIPLSRSSPPPPSSYVSTLLREASSEWYDVKVDGLQTLVDLTRSGEFQRMVCSDYLYDTALDGGAVDVLLGALRSSMSPEVSRLSVTAIANLIEYSIADVIPGDTECPRLAVSQACARRLIEADGVRSLLEEALSAEELYAKRESMRALLAVYRHMKTKEEIRDKKLLGKLILENNKSVDPTVIQLTADVSQVVMKLLK